MLKNTIELNAKEVRLLKKKKKKQAKTDRKKFQESCYFCLKFSGSSVSSIKIKN